MAPRIDAVEPPSWWLGTRHPRLRLLLRGAGLEGARVSLEGSGATVRANRWTPGGGYVFVDLRIHPDARPGRRTVVATTPAGRATASFELFPAAAARTRPLGTDDVLYLAVPDRFRDGDPGNNRPRGAEDLYDPRRPRHFHGGDLAGLRKALPYLQDLGITAVWTTPIVANSPRPHPTVTYRGEPAIDYHGYGAVDGYA
ncbi:MAG: cyclomaltodextrinase N-terminal domain-containing protein, partial [Armatimonadota bacterium]